MLRTAVIGLGVGEQHLAGYAAHPQAEPVAICDIDAGRLAAVAERHPGLRTTTDPAELLAAPDIDVVSIASYDDAHFAQIEAALLAGKHVFAEKPVVIEESQARRVRELLRERPGLRLSTNVPLRRSPRFVELRERLRGGELGALYHAEADYEYGRRHKLTDGWRGRQDAYSVFLGGGVHVVDLLLWLTGERPERVENVVSSRIATAGSSFQQDDFVMAVLTCPSGMTWKVTANLGSVTPHFHALRVYGRDGTFVNGVPDGVLHTATGSAPVTSAYPGVEKSVLIGPFLDSILSGEDGGVTADDVFDTLSVCFAVERARHEGRPVEVAWL